jgi:hypothetical protein
LAYLSMTAGDTKPRERHPLLNPGLLDHGIDQIRRKFAQTFRLAIRLAGGYFIHLLISTQAKMQAQIVLRETAGAAEDFIPTASACRLVR